MFYPLPSPTSVEHFYISYISFSVVLTSSLHRRANMSSWNVIQMVNGYGQNRKQECLFPSVLQKRFQNTIIIRNSKYMAKVTIKGVYQMNGPKPFSRVIECSSSEIGYYSQLMGNKSKQAQWIQANFPGANVSKGFSMSINIKQSIIFHQYRF